MIYLGGLGSASRAFVRAFRVIVLRVFSGASRKARTPAVMTLVKKTEIASWGGGRRSDRGGRVGNSGGMVSSSHEV